MELGLEHYIGSIRQIPRLTPEEEAAVGALCAAGDVSAQKRIVEANLRLVVHVAYRFQNCGLAMEDLIAEGALGLIARQNGSNPISGDRELRLSGGFGRVSSARSGARNTSGCRKRSRLKSIGSHGRSASFGWNWGGNPPSWSCRLRPRLRRGRCAFSWMGSPTPFADAPIPADGEGDLTLADQLAGEQAEPVSEALSLVEDCART